ncbi:MAG TPA: NAD-dependent epimerase/dehydratase family protein, partial [candidate division Zixibacteria bacterium]|nr:NAD-dependent epimerase/dehydratase family protein [candidate division Zixibacteria bacterium]
NIIISTENPREDYATNIGGTLNVLMAAREAPGVRVVYTSSASVYGNPRHLPISEDETPLTFSPYAVSKLAGENYCVAFYETYGVPVAAVRYSNVYGVKQSPSNPYCGVVSKFVEAISEGREVVVHGDGLQTRDFTYVGDTVEATLTALLSPRADGMVFNVGSGIEVSVLKLADEISRAMGKPARVTHVDRRDIDNIRRRVLNIERIRSRLRWQPRTTLREGIARTVQWWNESRSAGAV